jgi:hypothetical protein
MRATSFMDKDGIIQEVSLIMTGFRKCGISPLDPDLIMSKVETTMHAPEPSEEGRKAPQTPVNQTLDDLPTDEEELVEEAIKVLVGDRPERKMKQRTGSVIYTGNEFLVAAAKKVLKKPKESGQKRRRAVSEPKKVSQTKAEKRKRYWDTFRATGKRPAGRPPADPSDDEVEEIEGEEAQKMREPPKKRRRVETESDSDFTI